MALHTVTEDGMMGWRCDCGLEQSAHVSHEQVQYTGATMRVIALPPCACGIQTFLKVVFSEAELQAGNMIDPVTRQPTESHATAQRHRALAQQHMIKHEKQWKESIP